MDRDRRAGLLAGIDRTFDTYGDRYSCAAALREAIAEARATAFSGLSDPGGGRASVAAHAAVVDHLIRRAYAFVARYAGADRDPGRLPVAVIATGGYGRRELCPHSDLAVIVLHLGTDPAEHARVAVEALFPFLADAGLSIRHRVCSQDELRGLLHADPKEAAVLLDARFVTGDRSVWQTFRQEVFVPFLAEQGESLIRRWSGDVRARHAADGVAAMGKEPDLKRAPGGLLDLHALSRIDRAARAALPGDRAAAYPWDDGAAAPRLAELMTAADALLALRSALHLAAGRRDDRLDLERWPDVHARLGREAAAEPLPVELFLQRERRHGDVVRRALEHLLGVVDREMRPARVREPVPLSEVFHREGDRLVPRDDDLFEREPAQLVGAFRLLAERGLVASERLVHLARRDAPVAAANLREDPAAWEHLRAIFAARGTTATTLRALANAGVLGVMVPEFDAVVGLSRFEPSHAYTIDEHLLRAVSVADALEVDDDELSEELRALARQVPEMALLKVALFLHDLGVASDPGRSAVDSEFALPLLDRLGFGAERAEDVRFLVREQETMSRLGRPLDPRDEMALETFRRVVADPSRLRLLYLLTVCDLHAMSPTAYSRWPAELLRDLYQRTARRLEAAPPPHRDVVPASTDPRADHLSKMPRRYVSEVQDAEVAVHLDLARRVAEGDAAALSWDEGGATPRLWVVAIDRPRLLANLCGALAMSGFDIDAADAYTRADGVAFDRFLLRGEASRQVELAALRDSVRSVLAGEIEPGSVLARGREGAALGGARSDAVVRIESGPRRDRLVVTIEAPDRPGLLFEVAREVAAVGLDVVRAEIVTSDGRVTQTFEVRDADECLFVDARLEELRLRLVAAASGGTTPSSGVERGDQSSSSKRNSSS